MKKRNRTLRVIRSILLFVVAISLAWIAFHTVMKAYEQKKHPAWGQMVEVDGKEMHVYTKGEGEHTIVLLSGLGTAAPVLDYEPLIDEMAKDNKIVVVEPFGYGWSELTDKERTVENIVEEIRTALKKSKIEGPYILMPHSLSGIYSMYYAHEYPNEIKAIIGVDFTLPKALEYFEEPAPSMPAYLKYVAPTGLARIASYVSAENVLPIADEGIYSEENLDMTKTITAWKVYNRNIVDEANAIEENVKKTKEMSFPSNMPLLIFAAKRDKVTEDGKTNETFYRSQLGENPLNELVVLEGHHYLHWTRYKEMGEHVRHFTEQLVSR
ncbi:alpha/beta fold hydrolase [Peribacillus sp. NPDC097225]|uniref:alpha/beta fold hydrolase n=1 Tax=Peribacillus sp. NPDC097225 TaxID=3364400 RepID=UPI003829AC0D